MSGVTQKIRRFTGGISDQPDEQKLPGQVRDALNCTPDVVYGLLKRPGTNHLAELGDSGGKWFWINKKNPASGEERYVGQINMIEGTVRIWNLFDGREQRVAYRDTVPLTKDFIGTVAALDSRAVDTANEPYFTQGIDPDNINPEDLQVLTVNDVTYVTNRKVSVSMMRNEAEKREPEGFFELRTLAGATEYNLRFYDVIYVEAGVTKAELVERETIGDQTEVTYPATSPEFEVTNGFKFKVKQNKLTDDNGITYYTDELIITNEGSGYAVGDRFTTDKNDDTIEFNGFKYYVKVIEVRSFNKRGNESQGDETAIIDATYTTPSSGVTTDAILNSLITQIDGKEGFTAEKIGSGIYFTREKVFSVETTNGTLSRLLGPSEYEVEEAPGEKFYVATATDYTELPTQCKDGLVVLVANTQDTQFDDTYRIFEGDNYTDGPGVWAEAAQPGIPTTFNASTMPHAIVRDSYVDPDDPSLRLFLVGAFDWVPREVGDEETVERPSFAPRVGASFGRPINNIIFYRSRLGFLTDESIVLSRVDKPFDFWVKTAETSSAGDRIDLDVSNNYPSTLYAATVNNTGLIMFSENNQYLLTNGDIGALTPSTAQISQLSTYNFNPDSSPVSLGTTTGFVSNQGKYTRFYEMASVQREGEPDVVEQSKVIEKLLPQSLNLVTVSKENDIVALGKYGDQDIWLFRYFDDGQKRQQSSWFKWRFHGELVAHNIMFDSYYLVLKKGDTTQLVRCDLRTLGKPTTTFTYDTNQYKNIEKDSYRTFTEYALLYRASTVDGKNTVFDITDFPYFEDIKSNLVVLDLNVEEDANGKYQGRILVPKIYEENGNRYMRLRGTFPEGVVLGYTYNMSISLPSFYITKTSGTTVDSLDSGNLIVHRIKMNLGQIGYYETTLKRLGRNDYTQVYEAKPMDLYQADELGWMPDYEQTTSIYQRNKTFNLIIESEHPSPAALYSATLEGVYTENYYKRV